jgi:hypothetical protein
MVKYLVEKGANIHAKTKHGETPLDMVGEQNIDIKNFLKFKGAKKGSALSKFFFKRLR